MYFKNFPFINYSLDGGVTSYTMTDFFRRVKANATDILGSTAYDEYDVLDGDTPEITAHKLYRNADLHWVLLIANDIFDPRFDWPLSTVALNNYIQDKYGANKYAVHHYINSFGDIVHSSYAGTKTSITNNDYEIELNEAKRRIKIIKPEFVAVFVERFTGLLNDGD